MNDKGLKCLNKVHNPRKTILCLGYTKAQTKIINALIENHCLLYHTNNKIIGSNDYDFVISFGYRHILTQDVITRLGCPIFNLHISYLPYNRGAHPNFWSFYDNTPSGVTIHLIDKGIDTGPIVLQKYVNFKKNETTFEKTHTRLIYEIENLLIENIELILSDKWTSRKQRGIGSHHFTKSLPLNFSGWNSVISDEI